MSALTRTQANQLLGLVNRATGRQYRSLSQAARNFGLSGGAATQISQDQASLLIEEWSTRAEHAQPWGGGPASAAGTATSGDCPMSLDQAALLLGREVLVTTDADPDGVTVTPDAIELLEDGQPALRVRLPLAQITSWSTI